MLLIYNRKDKLEVVGIGIFEPGDVMVTDDEQAKRYIDSGHFDIVKEKKKKKSKKKGVDKL